MLGLIFDPLLMFAAILILGAFSGYLCERVGIVNIGIDGMMCIGALVFTIVSAPMFHISDMGPLGLLIALPITMVISSVTGFLHAFATIKLKTNHIISGTAINLIGIALATFLNNPLGMKLFGSSSLKSAFQSFLYIPAINVSGSSIIFFGLAIVICICLYFVMIKTKTGLRYRAIGENPNAVDAQGINVIKYQWFGVVISSLFASLAGALFVFNIPSFQGNVQGYGYLALGILIAGGWRLEWITVVGIVFGSFMALPQTTFLTNLGVPKELSLAIPYGITGLSLLIFSKKIVAPAHSGIPFDKGKR